MTGASTDDHQPTDDDMSPETLIREDGARDAHEAGDDEQADWDLSVVDENDIGGGRWTGRGRDGGYRPTGWQALSETQPPGCLYTCGSMACPR
jgi:hypothetical protein